MLDREELLNDPRFKTAAARKENDEALIGELKKVFATRMPQEWEQTLTSAGVACVETQESGMFDFFSQDPHVEGNGFIQQVESFRIGTLR